MRFSFSQIYTEPGFDFDLPGPLLRALREVLDGLGLHLEEVGRLLGTSDVEINFVIGALPEIEGVRVKGPDLRKKSREAIYSLVVPWVRVDDFRSTVLHVLPRLAEGVAMVLEKHGTDGSKVVAAINEFVEGVLENESVYQWPKK